MSKEISDRDLRVSTVNKTLEQKAKELKIKTESRKKKDLTNFKAVVALLSPKKKIKQDEETGAIPKDRTLSDSAFYSLTPISADKLDYDYDSQNISEEEIKEAADWNYNYNSNKEPSEEFRSSTPREEEVSDDITTHPQSRTNTSPKQRTLESIPESEETPKSGKDIPDITEENLSDNHDSKFASFPKRRLDSESYGKTPPEKPVKQSKYNKAPLASPRESSIDPSTFARLKRSPALSDKSRQILSIARQETLTQLEESQAIAPPIPERTNSPARIQAQKPALPDKTRVWVEQTADNATQDAFVNIPQVEELARTSTQENKPKIDNPNTTQTETNNYTDCSSRNGQHLHIEPSTARDNNSSNEYNNQWDSNMNSMNVNKFYGHKTDHQLANITDPINVPSHYLTIEELIDFIERSVPINGTDEIQNKRDDEKRGLLLLQACKLNSEGVVRSLLRDSQWNWEKCKTGLTNLYSETNSEVNDLHMLLKFRIEGRKTGECINIYFIRLKGTLQRLKIKFPDLNETLELKIKLLALVPNNKYRYFNNLFESKTKEEVVKELSTYLKQHSELNFQAKTNELTFPLEPNEKNKFTIEKANPGVSTTAKITKTDDQEIFAVIEELKQSMKINNEENISAIAKYKNQETINKQTMYEHPAGAQQNNSQLNQGQYERQPALTNRQQIMDRSHEPYDDNSRQYTNFRPRQNYQDNSTRPRYTNQDNSTRPRYTNQGQYNEQERNNTSFRTGQGQYNEQGNRNNNFPAGIAPRQPLLCFKCNKMGFHIARECNARPIERQTRYNGRQPNYRQYNTNLIENEYTEAGQYISNIDQIRSDRL